MSKMKELSMVLDELVTCGETLISTANALKDIFSEPAADTGPETGTTAKPKASSRTQSKAKAKAAPPEEAPEESAVPAEPPAASPAPKPITKEQVRGILAAKSAVGHSDEVRALLGKFGAKQLKQVDPSDYAALIKEADAIGSEAAGTVSGKEEVDANA